MTRIAVSDTIHLSENQPGDKTAYLEHFATPDVSRTLLRVPFPYTEADADNRLTRVAEQTKRMGRPVTWAIRRADGYLIGAVGFADFALGQDHMAEIAYWLAKPYWGQGIMPQVIDAVCRHAFAQFGLARIFAGMFDTNAASARVLEKSGFHYEGLLRRYYCKDGEYIDARMYARLKP